MNFMNTPADDQDIDLQIAEVISRWMEGSLESRPAASELVARHPELAPGLAKCLAGLHLIEQGKATVAGSGWRENEIGEDEVVFPVIPDFEVLGELGRGGMGVVYEARQLSLDRIVALKVLPFGAVDPRTVKRFLREAETVAALAHPGIVPIYAVGVHNGLNWFAMQRIDGCPLSQWFAVATFESRAATLREVVRVGIEAADALEHAHQRGVIHRDVKPGNLLVDTSGKVWLTDFGLARRDVDVTATATGAMLGTPRYMSAEQISGYDEEVDARTDIYSLGATLYEMATGRPPFTSESPLELLTQIRRDEPTPPRQIDATIPRTLELVILKCLDKERDRRYASAAALAEDLKAIRDDKPISAKGLPVWVTTSRFLKRNQRQVNAIAMSVLLTVATLIAAALLWQQNELSKLGSVRINTPAGLYVANIQPHVGESLRDSSDSSTANVRLGETDLRVVTTPMQQAVSLPAGDYRVRLEGAGVSSQTVDVVVKPKEATEIEYIDRRASLSQVDIYQKLSVPMHDNALAVLGKDTFEVFNPPSALLLTPAASPGSTGARGEESLAEASQKRVRFTLPIKELDAGLVEDPTNTRSGSGKDDDPPLTFAFDADQPFQGDYSVARSAFARIERISTSEVDLNQDSQSDFLITAARHAAIAALSSDGTVLWKRRLPMTFEIAEARSRYPKQGMTNEAIVGITPVNDLDSDGTPDLVINAALFEPSGFSRPYIFTLSGRDGSEIAVAPFPTIAMRNVRTWPWAGLLRHRRQFNDDKRSQRLILHHFDNITMRTRVHDLNNDSWGGNSANSALYVLPPLILDKHIEAPVAIAATDQAIHFINFVDGNSVSPAIQLAQPILRGPQRVHLADGKLAVLVLTGIPGAAFTKCFLELCVLGEPKPRWSIPQDIEAYDLAAGAADSTFPLVIDLDVDGNDEILSPTNPDVPMKWPKLHCYSTSGKLQWSSNGVAGLSHLIDQALPVADIDSDGIVDLAVVGLLQLSAAQASSLTGSASKEGLRLTVDFLSGKNGHRLGYREEHVAATIKNFDVVEIDYVELSGHELVCSVVYGSQEELKLSSISVAFDLRQFNQASVARGLTVNRIDFQPDNHSTGIHATGWKAFPPSSQGRWYRRRGGPYANPSDAAVWVARELKQTSYPGENLVASWISPTKEPRVLLGGRNGTIRCINPLDGRKIWTGERFFFDGNPVLVLDQSDGRTDLVLTTNGQSNATPGFYDSETGRLRFRIDSPKMDAIRFVTLDQRAPERFIYALAEADTSYSYGTAPKRDRGFLLLKIDRIAGRLLCWKNCYQGTNPGNPLRPTDPIQVDLNDDQVTDLITGNTKHGRLIVEAIDGRDGRVLWELPLQLDADDWPWREPWPMMTLIPSGNQRHLLVVDAVENEEKLFDLKSIRLRDGKELDTLRRKARFILRNDVQSQDLSLHVMSPEKRDGIVGMITAFPNDNSLIDPPQRVRTDRAFGMKMLHVDEQTGKFQEVDNGDIPYETAVLSEGPKLGPPDSIFTADMDGDGTLDRIEHRVAGQIKIRPANKEMYFDEFEITATSGVLIDLQQHLGKEYLKVTNNNAEHSWYELPGGKVALRFGQGLRSSRIGETHYPRLLFHSTGTLLVGSTPEAAMCVEVDMGVPETSLAQTKSLPVAMISADVDPRYRKAIVAHGLYDRKSFADVVRLALLTLGAILIPAGYVYRLVRRRQWSLQAMLLAPAILMLALVCWRALQSRQDNYLISDVIAGVMAALSVWAVFTLMRLQSWKIMGASIVLSMLVATLLMFGAQATIPLRSPGMIGYWTLGAWFTSVCAASAQIVMPMAVGVAVGHAKSKKAGSAS